MTRQEVRLAVIANLGRAGLTTDEQYAINRWINQVTRERICARHNWSAMEVTFDTSISTTASDDSYAWPNPTRHKDALWIEMRRASGEEWARLKEEDEDVLFDGRCYSNVNEGFPIAWARAGDQFHLRSIPDGIYPVRVKQLLYPAELSVTAVSGTGDDAGTNFVTTYWPQLLEAGVTARGFMFYEEPELVAQWTETFERLLQEAIVLDRQNLGPANMVLRPSLRAGKKEAGGGKRGWNARIWSGVPYDWY